MHDQEWGMGQKINVASASSMEGSNNRHFRRTCQDSAGLELITLNASGFLQVDIMAMVNGWLLKL